MTDCEALFEIMERAGLGPKLNAFIISIGDDEGHGVDYVCGADGALRYVNQRCACRNIVNNN